LLLRQQTATARGYGNDVKLPVLARLMLAERFIPRLFDQIAFAAAAHPKGYCDDLAALEATTGEKAMADTKAGKAKETGDAAESALLTEWLASPQIRAWSKVAPPLANVDLRPYLFVTKDRKDYFGAASALGHLAGVVEKLLGPKLAVQSLDADLKLLKEPEAAQVFEALRSRIMGEDSFMTAPPGIDGLSILVKTHPALQTNLLDFLGALPIERCGAWPVSGWQGVVTDQAAATRLTNLIEEWATCGKKSPLANAAIAARKMKSRSA
jgi:hypothetical protein